MKIPETRRRSGIFSQVFHEFYFIFQDTFFLFRQAAVYQVFKGFVHGTEALAVGVLVDGGFDDAELAFGHYGKAIFEVLSYLGVADIAYNQPANLPYPTENPFHK